MAEVYVDSATAISHGKRFLLVQDYTAAVSAFAEGLEMLSKEFGETGDELGEPYLLYGRSLLGLAREGAAVLGGGVPGADEADEDEDVEEDDGDEEKGSEEEDDKEASNAGTSGEASAPKEDGQTKKDEKADKKSEDEKTDKKPEADKSDKKPEVEKASNKTDDKKIEEEKSDAASSSKEGESVAGPSKAQMNGSATHAENSSNGTAGKSDEADDGEDVNKEDDEDDAGRGIDLQLAWEVLELAKIVFAKRGELGMKNLAEAHRLLGEVALESDNVPDGIQDLKKALELLQKIEPYDPRAIAEIHYQLGLAHSLMNDFDASISEFSDAATLLETRIKQLEETKEPTKSEDPFYSVEGEIKELKELLPAIQEKITDMKDFKAETKQNVRAGMEKVIGPYTNGAGSSKDGATSSNAEATSPNASKPASDISHLVRKKRKVDEADEAAESSPCKKPPV